MTETPTLKRLVTLPFLIFYGVGTIVGGGFYALLGEVSGEAGAFGPVSFLLSGLLALLSAVSFAELSSRFPVSAGESRYVLEGFGYRWLSVVVGWMVILTGVVSAATLARATTGFIRDIAPFPETLVLLLVVAALGAVAAWGIGQSVAMVVVITLIEVGALVYVVWLGAGSFGELPGRTLELLPPPSLAVWSGILSGTFLAFYSFIGFEDMVNIAEEVQDVERSLPIAILVSVVVTTFIYLLVSLVAILSVPPGELASSSTPIATIVARFGGSAELFGLVSVLAGLNGALVQVVMAARVAYGMSVARQAPAWMGAVNARTRTPLRSTAAATLVVGVLAAFFPLVTLARITSTIILLVFATVNLALWRVKKRQPLPPKAFRIPGWAPLVGFAACAFLLASQALAALG